MSAHTVRWGVALTLLFSSPVALARPALPSRAPAQTGPRVSASSVVAGVVINEIVAKAKSGGPDWIELYNAGTSPVDVSGWTFKDSDDAGGPSPDHLYTFPAGLTLEPGHYLVLTENATDGSGFAFGLGKADMAFLYDAAGAMVDSTSWQDGQAPEGSSWARAGNGLGAFTTLEDITRGEMNIPNDLPDDPGAYILDEGVVRDFNLIMDQSALDILSSDPTAEIYVPGYVEFEGQIQGPVGIRYKGSAGSLYSCFAEDGTPLCDKPSMKVSLHEYDESGRLYGLKKLQFHGMMNDPSAMHDRLGYKLFRQMGVAAPRVAYTRLFINDELQGLYIHVEQIDGVFTRDRFADGGEGNLYKEVWPLYDTPDPYLAALETNEDESPDVSLMVNFHNSVYGEGAGPFATTLPQYMDIPTFMNYLAVDRAINNWDGIMGWYCWTRDDCAPHNFYFYESVTHDELWLIPWDLDFSFGIWSWWQVFGKNMPDTYEAWYREPNLCTVRIWGLFFAQHPACDALISNTSNDFWYEYTAAGHELLESYFTEEGMTAEIDANVALIESAVAEDPDEQTLEEWQAAVEQLRSNVEVLRGRFASEISR